MHESCQTEIFQRRPILRRAWRSTEIQSEPRPGLLTWSETKSKTLRSADLPAKQRETKAPRWNIQDNARQGCLRRKEEPWSGPNWPSTQTYLQRRYRVLVSPTHDNWFQDGDARHNLSWDLFSVSIWYSCAWCQIYQTTTEQWPEKW